MLEFKFLGGVIYVVSMPKTGVKCAAGMSTFLGCLADCKAL